MRFMLNQLKKAIIGFSIAILLTAIGFPLFNKFVDMTKTYVNPDFPEINEKAANIKEKYGKNVYIGIDPYEFNRIPNINKKQLTVAVYDFEAIKMLDVIDKTLSKYSQEALDMMTDEIYVVNSIYFNNIHYAGMYEFVMGRSFILLATDELEGTVDIELSIDHEIFHGLTTEMFYMFAKESELPEGFEEKFNFGKDCVSDYACISNIEELAETWAYSIHQPQNVADYKYNLIKEHYFTKYLKNN